MQDKTLSRIVGVETEYTLIAGKSNESLFADLNFNSGFFPAMFPIILNTDNFSKCNDGFLFNGGRVYLDTGFHPEYSTPECQTIASLITYDMAGQRMMETAETYLNYCLNNGELPPELLSKKQINDLYLKNKDWMQKRFYPVHVFRNNLSVPIPFNETRHYSWGFHENYMIKADSHSKINKLISFLITRQIFGGSGWLNVNSNNNIELLFAQRPLVMCVPSGSGTTSNRPIINTRNEPFADETKHRRLHLIIGDSNMSPWAEWLKIKTTSMMLDLLEDDGYYQKISELDVFDPVRILKEISADTAFKNKFRTVSNQEHTALSLQLKYLELTEQFYLIEQRKEADKETIQALEFWQATLEAIKNNETETLAPYFDYFAKLFLFNSVLETSGTRLNSPDEHKFFLGKDINSKLFHRLKEMDLKYHRVNRKESIYHIFQNSQICQNLKPVLAQRAALLRNAISTEEDIQKAILTPPPGRAKWRRKFVELLEKANKDGGIKDVKINWDYCQFRYYDVENSAFQTFINNDPYCETTPDLNAALAMLE